MPDIAEPIKSALTHIATFLAGGAGLRILDHFLDRPSRTADIEEMEASADERRAKAAQVLADAAKTLIEPLQRHIQLLEDRVSALEGERDALRANLAEVRDERLGLYQKVSTLEIRIAKTSRENTRLKHESKELTKRVAVMEKILVTLYQASPNATRKLIENMSFQDCEVELVQEILNGIS